jgi:hypothetical protein
MVGAGGGETTAIGGAAGGSRLTGVNSGTGGGTTNAGSLPGSGILGTGATGGQSTKIAGLPADAVIVCAYTLSGAEHVITAYRDAARTSYYLVSNLSKSAVAHPIGTPDSQILVDRIANYEYLWVDILSGGLIRFVDGTNEFDEVCQDQGPPSSFRSTCNEDGVQIAEMFKDITLYLLFTRADGSVYHADLPDFWTPGSFVLNFYTAAPGNEIYSPVDKTVIGTQILTISRNPDDTNTISFLDLDNRRVTIRLDSYRRIFDFQTTLP